MTAANFFNPMFSYPYSEEYAPLKIKHLILSCLFLFILNAIVASFLRIVLLVAKVLNFTQSLPLLKRKEDLHGCTVILLNPTFMAPFVVATVAANRSFHCKVNKTKSTKVCFCCRQEGAHQTRVVEKVFWMMFFVLFCLFVCLFVFFMLRKDL